MQGQTNNWCSKFEKYKDSYRNGIEMEWTGNEMTMDMEIETKRNEMR